MTRCYLAALALDPSCRGRQTTFPLRGEISTQRGAACPIAPGKPGAIWEELSRHEGSPSLPGPPRLMPVPEKVKQQPPTTDP